VIFLPHDPHPYRVTVHGTTWVEWLISCDVTQLY
jgi:hypothetical protein